MSSPDRKQVLRSSENVARHPAIQQQPRKPSTNSSSRESNKQEPPKPPRSAFICFTDAKKKEIMQLHAIVEENDDILKLVAREWKTLSDKDRAHWDEEARNDKVRFVREKAAYKGSWAIPKRRAKKHPLAPKRPMSAFLKYSQTRRANVKTDNPDMSNTDVSRLLGEMWRNASQKERAPYVEQEERERKVYKEEIKKWRDDQARMDAASRSSHQMVQQNYRPHQPSLRHAQSQERSYSHGAAARSFENLRVDVFEDQGQKNTTYRPTHQYSNPYPLYRQTQYPPQQELSTQHSVDYHESDPIPVSQLPLAPAHPRTEEDDAYDHYNARTNSRSSYFAENMNVDYYNSRYH